MTRKYGANTDGRGAEGKFATGNPGKPKGARHKVTRAVSELMDGQADAITQKAIDMALAGDTTALRLCLERIAPPRKDAPIGFALPEVQGARDAGEAARAVLRAVSEGELTPSEGNAVMAIVDQFRRALEFTELEARIAALESK